jgi:hypothetical protein
MNPSPPKFRFFEAGVIFLLLAALHYRVSYTPADSDLWGHVRFGEDALTHGPIVSSDPYSYLTQAQSWINCYWLAERVFALGYNAMGVTGLVLLKVIVDFALITALFVSLLRCGLEPIRAGALILVAAFLLFYHILTVRPHIFTYLLFLATLLILERVENGRHRWLLALPPIFALWINLHPGVLAGWGTLVAWSSAHVIFRARETSASSWKIGAALVASTAALLLNPYGVALPRFVFRALTMSRADIVEWQSVVEERYHFIFYLALLGASSYSIISSARDRRPSLIIVYMIWAITPLLAIRHLPLFAIATILLAGEFMAEAWNREAVRLGATIHRLRHPKPGESQSGPTPSGTTSSGLDRGVGIVSVAGGLLLLSFSLPNYRCIPIVTRLMCPFPARAVAVLAKTERPANLVTHFNWGEYCIWHLGPRIKLSIDGRRETIYSEAVREENSRFMRGEGDWAAIVRRPETDLALVPRESPAFNLLVLTPEWITAYQDPLCTLFARKGSAWEREVSQLVAPDIPCDGEGLCFPGG